MLRFIKRVLRESIAPHLLIPLGVSMLVGSAMGFWQGKITSTSAFFNFWQERLLELVAIYATFVVVLVLLIWRETSVRMANVGTLNKVLKDSSGYFAFAAIPFNEWFDPSVQVYLARIVARQQEVERYSYERVLLFFSRGDLEAAHAGYLDEYHARCLIEIHKLQNIGLAFLSHDHLFEVLASLQITERRVLGCYPLPMSLLPDWMLKRVPLWRRRIPALAFAVVSYTNDRSSVVLFSKGRKLLNVRQVNTTEGMVPYLNFVKLVRERIHQADGNISPEYDFAEHMVI